MTKQPDKKHIRNRFARSLTTYSANAPVQAQLAWEMMARLTEIAGTSFNRILEVGCGSGLFTELIHSQMEYHSLFLNDIVEKSDFLTKKIPNSHFTPGDIETIADLPNNLDLIVSNAVFQWLHNLPKTCCKLANMLTPGRIMAFSTFGPDNLSQLRQITGIGLNYYSLPELESLLSERFEILFAQETTHTLEMPDAISVLRHIKNTGVSTTTQTPWTKTTLNNFATAYKKHFSCDNGVTLTYNPIMIIAKALSNSN